MKLRRERKQDTRAVLYNSTWVRVTHRHDVPSAVSVEIEFTLTGIPGFRCSPGDAHELGQALYHAGKQLLDEEYGGSVRPMPHLDAPDDD